MVGVPHSTGCALCRERRIKCDQAKPQCLQCRKYRRPCPGYKRTFRFQDERPALERRHQSSLRARSSSANSNESPLQDAASTVRNNNLAIMEQATSARRGEQHSTMAAQYVVTQYTDQQPEFFLRFIYTAFQTTQDYNRFRATDHPDFTTHIISNFGRNACLDAAVCAASAVFQAQTVDASENLPYKGREAYNYALNAVSQALGDATHGSDKADMIGAIILLSIFEMRVQTLPDAWLKHVRGVQSLMEELGAEAHRFGFARACYVFFRGFLLATAFHQEQPCFLEKEEWQRLAEMIRVEDSQKPGEGAAFVDVTERIFMELVRFPRYVQEAKCEPEAQQRQQTYALSLRCRILESQRKLVALVYELKDLMRERTPNQRGPTYLLYGAENAIDLSGSIVKRLSSSVPIRISSGLHVYIEEDFIGRDASLLDCVACSMGMLGTVESTRQDELSDMTLSDF